MTWPLTQKCMPLTWRVKSWSPTGQLDVSKKVPEFTFRIKDQEGDKGPWAKNDLTVREILEHQAGFPPRSSVPQPQLQLEKPTIHSSLQTRSCTPQSRDEISGVQLSGHFWVTVAGLIPAGV